VDAQEEPDVFERGVFNRLAIRVDSEILELSCGDGFATKYFYSQKAKRVIAVDYDRRVIDRARKVNSSDNIEYLCMDVKVNLPAGEFDNVIWDIVSPFSKYFTEEQISSIFARIKSKTKETGCFSGHTHTDERKSEDTRMFLLKSKSDLYRLLTPHFNNVCVFETVYEERHNLYFWASDGEIPFLHKQRLETAK